MKTLVIYGSTRRDGNSHTLAKKALDGVEHTEVWLKEYSILPVKDQRHEQTGFDAIHDDYDQLIQQFMSHDRVVFVTPVYWYGMSGYMKDFVDRWSQTLRDERFSFKENVKGKLGFAIITGGDQPRIKGLPLIQQFHYIFDFMSMRFEGYIIGEGNKPEDILADEQALSEAGIWNNKWKK